MFESIYGSFRIIVVILELAGHLINNVKLSFKSVLSQDNTASKTAREIEES